MNQKIASAFKIMAYEKTAESLEENLALLETKDMQ